MLTTIHISGGDQMMKSSLIKNRVTKILGVSDREIRAVISERFSKNEAANLLRNRFTPIKVSLKWILKHFFLISGFLLDTYRESKIKEITFCFQLVKNQL